MTVARAAALAGLLLWWVALGSAGSAAAATVRVAVAANFQQPVEALAEPFRSATGHELAISAGSSGKLAAQIEQGAPFDVFLSADAERPAHLIARGAAVAGSRFTYARGRLVLWSARPGLALGPDFLRAGGFRHLAVANPRAAPYGAAALEVLARLGLRERLDAKLVRGESIGQTWTFVASAAAELGFVARSQVDGGAAQELRGGSFWVVPAELHTPIEQQAVLLAGAAQSAAARAFLTYLRGAEARRAIVAFGYEAP